eukprot:TRINITY_DN15099_c0_g2_i3.p1 TRINITY_DN15099_c0_g2~~TRINITY_DN15099_c0_g2_i3.p1  ORF type:complete len:1050 (-),score=343.88 TRINITY_DN15099_c0_g2_i3:592-3741(-)
MVAGAGARAPRPPRNRRGGAERLLATAAACYLATTASLASAATTRGGLSLEEWCNRTVPMQMRRLSTMEQLLATAQRAAGAPTPNSSSGGGGNASAVLLESLESQRMAQESAASAQRRQRAVAGLGDKEAELEAEVFRKVSAELAKGKSKSGLQAIQLVFNSVESSRKAQANKMGLLQVQDMSAELHKQARETARLEHAVADRKADVSQRWRQHFTSSRSLGVLTTALEDESAYLAMVRDVCGVRARVASRRATAKKQGETKKTAPVPVAGVSAIQAAPSSVPQPAAAKARSRKPVAAAPKAAKAAVVAAAAARAVKTEPELAVAPAATKANAAAGDSSLEDDGADGDDTEKADVPTAGAAAATAAASKTVAAKAPKSTTKRTSGLKAALAQHKQKQQHAAAAAVHQDDFAESVVSSAAGMAPSGYTAWQPDDDAASKGGSGAAAAASAASDASSAASRMMALLDEDDDDDAAGSATKASAPSSPAARKAAPAAAVERKPQAVAKPAAARSGRATKAPTHPRSQQRPHAASAAPVVAAAAPTLAESAADEELEPPRKRAKRRGAASLAQESFEAADEDDAVEEKKIVYDDDDLPKHKHLPLQAELSGGWRSLVGRAAPKTKPKADNDVALMQSLFSGNGGLPTQYQAWKPDDNKPPAPAAMVATSRSTGEDEGVDGGAAADAATRATDGASAADDDAGDADTLTAAPAVSTKRGSAKRGRPGFLQAKADLEDDADDDDDAAPSPARRSARAKRRAPAAASADAGDDDDSMALAFTQLRQKRSRHGSRRFAAACQGLSPDAGGFRMAAAASLLQQFAAVLKSSTLKQLAQKKFGCEQLSELSQRLQAADPHGPSFLATNATATASKAARAAKTEAWCAFFQQHAATSKPLHQAAVAAERAGDAFAAADAARGALAEEKEALTQLVRTVDQDVQSLSELVALEQKATQEEGRVEMLDLLQVTLDQRSAVAEAHRQKAARVDQDLAAAERERSAKQAALTHVQASLEAVRKRMAGIRGSCEKSLAALDQWRHSAHVEARVVDFALRVVKGRP